MTRWVFMFEITAGVVLFVAGVYQLVKAYKDSREPLEPDEHENESIG